VRGAAPIGWGRFGGPAIAPTSFGSKGCGCGTGACGCGSCRDSAGGPAERELAAAARADGQEPEHRHAQSSARGVHPVAREGASISSMGQSCAFELPPTGDFDASPPSRIVRISKHKLASREEMIWLAREPRRLGSYVSGVSRRPLWDGQSGGDVRGAHHLVARFGLPLAHLPHSSPMSLISSGSETVALFTEPRSGTDPSGPYPDPYESDAWSYTYGRAAEPCDGSSVLGRHFDAWSENHRLLISWQVPADCMPRGEPISGSFIFGD
jgi:hypothetical protein